MLRYIDKLACVKQIAIYLRKSRQDEGHETEATLANHRNILTRIADEQNWYYDIFEEVASSIDMDSRIELTKMLKQMKTGRYDAVLVIDVDRLSRSVKDSAIIKAILAENDVLIITADLQVIDLNEDNDSLVSDFMDVLSSFEYKQIRKRLMRGKRAGAEKGEWNNGVAPFGYKVDKENKTLLIIEDQALIVRMVFTWTIQKKGSTWIADELNRLGIKTKNKHAFSEVAIRRIIRNETYKGCLIRHRIKWNGKKKEKHPTDNWVIVKNTLPAIVSEEIWEQAINELNQRSKEPMRIRASTFGLTGLVKCGYCGYSLSIMRRKDRKTDLVIRGCHRKYPSGEICKNSSISYYALINAIMGELRVYEEKLKEEVSKLEIQESDVQREQKLKYVTLESVLKKIDKAIQQIDIAFEEAIINVEEYKLKRKNIFEQKESLNEEKKLVEKIVVKNGSDEKKEVLTKLKIFIHEYHTLSQKQLNSCLRAFIEKVELFNDRGKENNPRVNIYYV